MQVIKEKGKTIFICGKNADGKDKKKGSRKNQKEEKNLSVEEINKEAGSASNSTEEVD